MRYLACGALCLFLTGCFARDILDREGFDRASVRDPNATRSVGSDAKPVLSVDPGEKYYVKRGMEGRQVHMYSKQSHRTTVVSGKALRKGRIVIIASYPGEPPPPKNWKP